MIAVPVLPEVVEDLFEGRLPKRPLGLRGDLDRPFLLALLQVSPLLELLDEILERLVVPFGQVVLVVELSEPVERLLGVAGRVLQEILEEVEQLFKQRLLTAVPFGVPLRIAKAHGEGGLNWRGHVSERVRPHANICF